QFHLQERDRIRVFPVSKYYPNLLALLSILVELVQLNSLNFDSMIQPERQRNAFDQIPTVLKWFGCTGIIEIGIVPIEIKATLCYVLLVVWFFMLKFVNKFQESRPMLNHVLTKDFPSLLHGFLYMSTVLTFFSFVTCVDFQGRTGQLFVKCMDSGMTPPPFLMRYQSITCWGEEHRTYALLGMWGLTFFLSVGLLSRSSNQVLFEQETLDIKFTQLVIMCVQFMKALTAVVTEFVVFNSFLRACIGLAGNELLLLFMLGMKGSSLWFIQIIKAGIYTASCWWPVVSLYRITKNDVYGAYTDLVGIGYWCLALVVVALTFILWRVRQCTNRAADDKNGDGSQTRWSSNYLRRNQGLREGH
uniref:Uncharacterized protein n=1 Tax=Globisporangium ultimum (strain ATCC 200006 / CBS 805.95 / DAOM BR144) TaxID=431595 RepID=K3WMX3_GLOUD